MELSAQLIAEITALDKGKVVSQAELLAAGESSFLELIESIARKATDGFSNHRVRLTRACIVDQGSEVNAYAYVNFGQGNNRHLVLVTRELLTRIRALGWQSQFVVLAINELMASEDEFRTIWGVMPNDAAHSEAFAEMLVHVVLAILIHHEMAHIAFQHVVCLGKNIPNTAAMDEQAAALVDSLGTPSASGNLREQALEIDADMHAIEWTQVYLVEQANRLAQMPISHEIATNSVWDAFVGTVAGRRFIIVASTWALLMMFNPRSFKFGDAISSSHPPPTFRMLALLHAERTFAHRRNPHLRATVQTGAALFALMAYSGLKGAEKILHQTPSPDSLGSPSGPIKFTVQDAARECGIYATLGRWDEAKKYLQTMADERLAISVDLNRQKLCSERQVVNWFGAT